MIINDPIALHNDMRSQRVRAVRRLYDLLFGKHMEVSRMSFVDHRDWLILRALDSRYSWSAINDSRERFRVFTFDMSEFMDYHYFAERPFHLKIGTWANHQFRLLYNLFV